MEHYDFNSVKDTLPVGTITYYVSSPQYMYADMYIYESYENTIALLKKYDLYSKPEFDVSKINELTVTNNAPGYDYEKLNAEEIAGLSINYENAKTVTYSDKESIQKIVGSLARSSSLYMDWYDYSKNINNQYTVQIYIDGANYGRYGVPYFSFKLGEVPDFVIKDTNN